MAINTHLFSHTFEKVESPQPDAGGARTCNGKPDPCGNAKIILDLIKHILIFLP